MIEIKNPSYYWLDRNTFCLLFDGGVDEDGDEYSYLVEYWKDQNKFVFIIWYEFENNPAPFTDKEKEYIIQIMLDKMREEK